VEWPIADVSGSILLRTHTPDNPSAAPPEVPTSVRLVRRWGALWTAPVIFAGAILSCGLAWMSVQLLSSILYQQHYAGREASFIVHGFGYVFLILTATIIAGAVVAAFRQGNRKTLLITVLVSYFSLMLIFASLYYEAAFFGDFEDALFKYHAYRASAQAGITVVFTDRRAFRGIEHRFWSGVDWNDINGPFVDGLPIAALPPTPRRMQELASTRTLEDMVRFIPGSQVDIFADCLYYSVMTMTTVGYGDITPRSPPARLAADVEAVCNTLLLIFGLGTIFGFRPPPEMSRTSLS
jgi:voltage-gated potassium channel Kch